ncbi:hrpN-interacting protein from malus protein [Carex rostrata]
MRGNRTQIYLRGCEFAKGIQTPSLYPKLEISVPFPLPQISLPIIINHINFEESVNLKSDEESVDDNKLEGRICVTQSARARGSRSPQKKKYGPRREEKKKKILCQSQSHSTRREKRKEKKKEKKNDDPAGRAAPARRRKGSNRVGTVVSGSPQLRHCSPLCPPDAWFEMVGSRGVVGERWSQKILWCCAIGTAVSLYFVAVERHAQNRQRAMAQGLKALDSDTS